LALLGLYAALALALSAPALAETLSYPADFPPRTLREIYHPDGLGFDAYALAPSGYDGSYIPPAVDYAKSTSLTGNSVTHASGGTPPLPDAVYGAVNFRDTDALSGNQVFITGGTVSSHAYGAYHEITAGNTSANDNHVTVSDGTISNANCGVGGVAISADSGNAQARDNTVRITGGTHNTACMTGGGATANGSGVSASATGNSVTLEDGSIGDAFGGSAYCVKALSTASATGNTVDIRGGTVNHNVFGAQTGCGAGTASASNNTVDISGGEVLGDVTAGYVITVTGSATAKNNTIKISGTPDLSAATLHGGTVDVYDATGTKTTTGNTLQLAASGRNVMGLADFQHLDFTLSGFGTELTVIGTAFAPGDALTVAINAPAGTVNTGDTIALISANTLNGTFTPTSGTVNGYAYTLRKADDQLLLTIGAAATTTAPAITSADHVSFVTGTGGSFKVTATGDPVPTFALSGAPSGVSINSATGVMSVAASVPTNISTFTITASNGVSPDATQTFTLTVTARRDTGSASSAPALSNAALAALGLLFAALAFVTLRGGAGRL
jgi:hypothetical protein